MGNLYDMKRVQQKYGIDINQGDYDKRTALHLAAEEGHEEIVEYLLGEENINVNVVDRWQTTPLKGAIKNGRKRVIAMLKDKGARLKVEETINVDNKNERLRLERVEETYRELFEKIGQTKEKIMERKILESYLKSKGFELEKNLIMKKQIDVISKDDKIEWNSFKELMMGKKVVLQRALAGNLILNDWKTITEKIIRIYKEVAQIKDDGVLPDYITKYTEIDPNSFGISLCSVDGQTFNYGDNQIPISIQSCVKPFIYSMAIDEYGYDQIHQWVGKEPSGAKWNAISVNHELKPHNPMVNSGCLTVCALYHPEYNDSARIKSVMQKLSTYSGDKKVGFQNEVYLSEKDSGDINRSLSYYLAAKKALPKDVDIIQNVDFYLQLCSLEVTNEMLGISSATLSNYGECPLTGKRVVSPSSSIRTMQLMFSCGMFEYSGEWACTVGLPGKAGISGGLFLCVPGICGISIFSPLVDESGIPVKGKEFSKKLAEEFNWNIFTLLEDKNETKISINFE